MLHKNDLQVLLLLVFTECAAVLHVVDDNLRERLKNHGSYIYVMFVSKLLRNCSHFLAQFESYQYSKRLNTIQYNRIIYGNMANAVDKRGSAAQQNMSVDMGSSGLM